MDDVRLSRRAKVLLKELHQEMTRRENRDISRVEARMFAGPQEIQQDLLQTWRVEDILSACGELADKGLIDLIPGDNTVQLLWLTDDGIVWCESSGERAVSRLWRALERIRSLLPW